MTTSTFPPSARTAELLRAGLTPGEIQRHVAGDRLRRVSWGVYAAPSPGGDAEDPDRRRRDHVELARHLLPLFPGAYVVGPSACLLHALPTLTIPDRLHLAREPRVRSRRDEVTTHRAWDHALITVDGLLTQSAPAAVVETAAAQGLLAGLIPGDAAARRGGLLHGASAVLEGFGSKRGATAARLCLELVDGRRESPLESWAACQAHTAGFTLVPQTVIRDAHGEWLAQVDFTVEGRNVVVEVDGVGKYTRHSDFKNERVRHNQIEEQGWIVVRITADDLRAGRFIPRLADAIARSTPRA